MAIYTRQGRAFKNFAFVNWFWGSNGYRQQHFWCWKSKDNTLSIYKAIQYTRISTIKQISNRQIITSLKKVEKKKRIAFLFRNQCQTQSIFGDTIYLCYYKLRLVTCEWLAPMVGAEGTNIFDFDNPLFGKRITSKITSTY